METLLFEGSFIGGIIVFFQKHKRILVLVPGLILALAVAVFSYGYLKRLPEIYGRIHQINNNDREEDLSNEQKALQSDETDRQAVYTVYTDLIGKDSIMVLERYYTGCGHYLIEEHPMENRYIGKNREELAQAYPNWTLKLFTPQRLVLRTEIDSYCPDHYMIKEENGFLVIFRPDKDTGIMLIVEATNIRLERLDSRLQEQLSQGIVVDGIEGVELFMENLES
jgi:hypothetical protein